MNRLWSYFAGFLTAALVAFDAAAAPRIVRPGACPPRPAVLYVVREPNPPAYVLSEDERVHESVSAFLGKRSRGWASRHLLLRFDLALEPDETIVENGGAFCTEGRDLR